MLDHFELDSSGRLSKAMKVWRTDEELFTIIRQELFTCVVGDVMDKMGLQHQFLPPRIRPLRPDMVVIGRAMPDLPLAAFERKPTGPATSLFQKRFDW